MKHDATPYRRAQGPTRREGWVLGGRIATRLQEDFSGFGRGGNGYRAAGFHSGLLYREAENPHCQHLLKRLVVGFAVASMVLLAKKQALGVPAPRTISRGPTLAH